MAKTTHHLEWEYRSIIGYLRFQILNLRFVHFNGWECDLFSDLNYVINLKTFSLTQVDCVIASFANETWFSES